MHFKEPLFKKFLSISVQDSLFDVPILAESDRYIYSSNLLKLNWTFVEIIKQRHLPVYILLLDSDSKDGFQTLLTKKLTKYFMWKTVNTIVLSGIGK